MHLETDVGHDSKSKGDGELDLDQEWAEARAAAGLPEKHSETRHHNEEVQKPVDISPFTLLFSGFLLGPISTFLLALYFGGRSTKLRDAAIYVGVCGAAWSLAQAVTFWIAGSWPTAYVQMSRSAINLAAGVLVLWSLWKKPGVSFLHDRQSLVHTAVLIFVMIVAYLGLPAEIRVWLGR